MFTNILGETYVPYRVIYYYYDGRIEQGSIIHLQEKFVESRKAEYNKIVGKVIKFVNLEKSEC